MAATLVYNTRNIANGDANETNFHVVGSIFNSVDSSGQPESVSSVIQRTAGVYERLFVLVTQNTSATTSTVRFRKNAGDGNMNVSIAAGTTGEFTDLVNADAVVDGDVVALRTFIDAGGSALKQQISMTFTSPTTTMRLANLWAAINLSAASTTFFCNITGSSTSQAVAETLKQYRSHIAGTWENLGLWVVTNGRSTASVVRSRINAGDGNQTVSITASTTGIFEDTSNQDTVAVDDLLAFSTTTGTGTGNLSGVWIASDLTPSSGISTFLGSTAVSVATVNASVTTYMYPGSRIEPSTTESDTAMDMLVAGRFAKLQIYIGANTVSATSTFKLRKNAADGNQSVSITASTSGWFSDASNTDDMAVGDELDFQLITGGSGTSLTVATHGVMFTPASGLLPRLQNEGLFVGVSGRAA